MDDRTERLATLSERLRAFLLDQIRKIEEERNQTSSPDAAAGPDLEAERKRLYQEIEQERDRLATEAQLLVDAWKQLEEERREMLAEAEIARLAGSEPANRSPQSLAVAERPPAPTPPAGKESASFGYPAYRTPSEPLHTGYDDNRLAAANSALDWFEIQQLRREMQQHTACQS